VIVDLEALPVQAKFLALSSLRRITDGDGQRGCRLHDGSDDGVKDIRGTGSRVFLKCNARVAEVPLSSQAPSTATGRRMNGGRPGCAAT
jgi:hypothetical protein